MFSALKRLTGPKIENALPAPNTSSHQVMSQNLQKKFSKGVHYNMKIIIKGDRSTGKTCLFNRLQGKNFIEDYCPTEEIQVASIQWNYKTTDDVVKVEVWDIVDKGKKKPNQKLEGLKLSECETPVLDAEFLDVYKATNGVILVVDITKFWTFKYAQKEAIKIPIDIPVLILGNHCDMSHHRTVGSEDISYFIDSLQRPKGAAQVRYAEASMSNGFGLMYIHKFFCLPFLQLQKETLLRQLETNVRETELTIEELNIYQLGPDADYNVFLENLSRRRRQAADSAGINLSQSQSCTNLSSSNHMPSIILGQGLPIDRSISNQDMKGATVQNPLSNSTPNTLNHLTKSPEHKVNFVAQVVTSVEEFIPDGGFLDKAFLEEAISGHGSPKAHEPTGETDSDCDAGENPLVAVYQDDLDPDDHLISNGPTVMKDNVEDDSIKLNSWMGQLGMSGGRQSPEGGEDTGCVDSSLTYSSTKQKSEGKNEKKKSKKKIKDKEDVARVEKKKKKKKISYDNTNDLESFLSTRDASYEAI